MQTAIVIVSYNGQKWLEKCLKSCQTYAPQVPVYVIDNASTDNSAVIVAGFPEIKLFKQEINLGFAGGNNFGIKTAINDGAEAVFLLNQDTEITAGCLDLLVEYLKNNPVVGGVQPAILLPDGRVNSIGNSFHYLGFAESGGNGLTMEEAKLKVLWLKNNTEPPYLSGAAVLLRTKALQQVGFFNQELFMYHEDLELSLRLRIAGWRLAVLPVARVVHYYESARSRCKYYYMERNRLIVWNEIFSWRTLLLLGPFFIISEIMLLIISIFKGWFLEKFKSYGYFMKPRSWSMIFQFKRQIKSLGNKRNVDLLAYAADKIVYQAEETGFLTKYLFNPLSAFVWRWLKPLFRW